MSAAIKHGSINARCLKSEPGCPHPQVNGTRNRGQEKIWEIHKHMEIKRTQSKGISGECGHRGGLRRQAGVSEGRHVARTAIPRPPTSWERAGASGCVTATSRRAPRSPSDPGRVGPRKVSRADKVQEGHPAGRGTQAQPPRASRRPGKKRAERGAVVGSAHGRAEVC